MVLKLRIEINTKQIFIDIQHLTLYGSGLFFIIPCMDDIRVVDLRSKYETANGSKISLFTISNTFRTISFDVPPQEILTKDSVTVAVDAVCFFKVRFASAAFLLSRYRSPWHQFAM